MNLRELLALISALIGGAFMLVAAIGVLRLPDVYLRLHCSSKAATLGVVCLLVAAALPSGDPSVWWRCAAAAAFSILTAPVVGHALGLAALRTGQIPLEDPGPPSPAAAGPEAGGAAAAPARPSGPHRSQASATHPSEPLL
jgi:multicomponent Na+:H+ antiporter subunit G